MLKSTVSMVLFVFSLILTSPLARTQVLLSPGSSVLEIDRKIAALSGLPALQTDEMAILLNSVGYQPEMDSASWRLLPGRQKLEAAYRSALAVNQRNADNLISLIAYRFSERYESLQYEPSFRNLFLSDRPSQEPRISFKRPSLSLTSTPLPPDIKKTISILSAYISGPGELSRMMIATRNFGLGGKELDHVLSRRNGRDFLKAASILAAKPPPVHERLNSLIKDVFTHSEASAFDVRLHAVEHALRSSAMPQEAPSPAEAMAKWVDPKGNITEEPPPPGSGGGGGGGSPSRFQHAADMNQRLDNHFYRNPGQLRFSAVRARAAGRGGVIAGADVQSTLPKPLAISLKLPENSVCGSSKTPIAGTMEISTRSGIYYYRNVPCDILSAAKRMIYDRNGSGLWQPGDAIGLASIDSAGLEPTFPVFIGPDGNPASIGKRFRMFLHPALIDLNIGRSIAFLDLWPSAQIILLSATQNNRHVAKWLAELKHSTTWKWSDSPTRIIAAEKELKVIPLKGSTILSMRMFDDTDAMVEAIIDSVTQPGGSTRLQEFLISCRATQAIGDCPAAIIADKKLKENVQSRTTHRTGKDSLHLNNAAIVLRTRLMDFARAEELLKVLAIFRWARESGAVLKEGNVLLAAQRTPTPDVITVAFAGTHIAGQVADSHWGDDCKLAKRRIELSTDWIKAGRTEIEKERGIHAVSWARSMINRIDPRKDCTLLP